MNNTVYGVMIIDDDVDTREYLRAIIDWNSLGLRFVCEAGNYDVAREMFLVNRPQIVISDICIPGGNGLDLIKEFIDLDSELRFIIITGYDNFEHAKTAISLGAVDLLSKPFTPERINDSLRKSIAFYEDMRREFFTSSTMKMLLDDNRGILQEKMLNELFQGDYRYTDIEIQEQLRLLELDIHSPFYTAAVVIADDDSALGSIGKLHQAMIKKIIENRLQKSSFKCACFFHDSVLLRCMIGGESIKDHYKVEDIFMSARSEIENNLGLRIAAGVGDTIDQITAMSQSSNQAETALRYKGLLDSGSIISFSNVKSVLQSQNTLKLDQKALREQLNHLVRTLDYDRIATLVHDWSSPASGIFPDKREMQHFAFQFLSILTQGSPEESVSGKDQDFTRTLGLIFASETPSEIEELLLFLTRKVFTSVHSARNDHTNKLVEAMRSYIADHITDPDFCLDSMSSHFGFSKVHFCRLFQKHVGVGFSNYVNQEKTELAKKLLAETDQKVFEIGEQIGYNSVNHFINTFKRMVGETPMEYKKRLRRA